MKRNLRLPQQMNEAYGLEWYHKPRQDRRPNSFCIACSGTTDYHSEAGRPTILVALLCYEQSIVTAWMSILVQLGTLCYDLSSSPSHMNLLHRISWWLMHRAFNSFGTS